eukprot:5138882-Amphidinium_carterae.2
MHVGIAPVRKSLAFAGGALSEWLGIVLQLDTVDNAACPKELRAFYAALRVDPTMLSLVSEEMRLWWEPASEKLHVWAEFMGRHNTVELLSVTLLQLWRFPPFCASRW